MRAAGYIRVSTDEQVRNGWNLGADRERITEICNREGWTLAHVYDDGGRQGDDEDRPGFNGLLDDVGKYDVIVLRSLDRLSRDLYLYALAKRAIQRAGVKVHDFKGPVDLDSVLPDFLAVMSQDEKRQIGVRVRQAKEARAKAGGHPGGKRPFGYVLADTGRRGKNDKIVYELRPHPREAAVVVRIFEMAMATSQRQIAAILNAEGIPASKGGRWTQSQVARTLGSPLYLGEIRRKVNGEWVLYDGQHDAIVDPDLWHRVNASRATPQRRVGGRPLKSSHALTRGLLRCGSCSSAMIPVASYEGRPETYICVGRRNHGPDFCRQPSVRRELIDTALLDELTKRYFDVDGARERIRERQGNALPLAKAAVTDAVSELAKAEARIAKATRGWHDEVISDDEYKLQRTQLDEQLAGAHAAVEQAQGQVAAVEAAGAVTDAEEELLRHLADLKALVSGTVDQARDIEALRTVIRQLFAAVELCSREAPFGHGDMTLEGLIFPQDDAPDLLAGPYHLHLYLRYEALDLQHWEPVKAPVPGLSTPSTYPAGHFTDVVFAPIEVLA